MILQAQDKSNANINRRLMGSFKSLIDDLKLKELRLQGIRESIRGQMIPTN
jgi:hypothetical protein